MIWIRCSVRCSSPHASNWNRVGASSLATIKPYPLLKPMCVCYNTCPVWHSTFFFPYVVRVPSRHVQDAELSCTVWIRAVRHGDIDAMRWMIASNVDVNTQSLVSEIKCCFIMFCTIAGPCQPACSHRWRYADIPRYRIPASLSVMSLGAARFCNVYDRNSSL